MHWILWGAAKQEAQPSLATYSRGNLPTVGSVHISCNVNSDENLNIDRYT